MACRCRYQLTMRGPQNIHTTVPTARKGPYGTAVKPPSFARPRRMRIPPTNAPANDETMTVNRTATGPKNAPIAPSYLVVISFPLDPLTFRYPVSTI